MKIKKEKKRRRKKLILLWITALFAAAMATGCVLLFIYDRQTHHYHSDSERKADIAALSSEDYDVLLLSTYAPEVLDEDPFVFIRGQRTLRASHTFANLADIGAFLEEAFRQNPDLSSVYIALDPAAVSRLYGDHASLYAGDYAKYLIGYAEARPDTFFELLLPCYSLEYLQSLSDRKFDELIAACRNLVTFCMPYQNIQFYFPGSEEWLIANPGNFDVYNTCNKGVTSTILSHTLDDYSYLLTADNMEEHFTALAELVNRPPAEYPDYSDYSIVFFGDSVIGNFRGSLSIPGVANGLSGASVYNIGMGGTRACGDPDSKSHSLNTLVDAFLAEDASSLADDSSPYIEISAYQSGHPDKHCFLINYGLNDFFCGVPISSEDANDPYSFSGSIRIAVAKLRKAFPNCRIILATPNFTSYYNDGMDKQSDVGGTMEDYVDAILALAEELDVDCMNNYVDFGIDSQNWPLYLADGCHPNEYLRYIYGQRIVEKLSDMLSTD